MDLLVRFGCVGVDAYGLFRLVRCFHGYACGLGLLVVGLFVMMVVVHCWLFAVVVGFGACGLCCVWVCVAAGVVVCLFC